MRIPELLAPVGGPAQLFAAVNNGADAVYLGGSRFNARAKADNFPLPKLRDAIAYAHERNVKVYVTFNTLLKDRELADALDYAAALQEIGADAVIVQDMGLVRILGRYLPDLSLHLSTQATVYNPQAVELMKGFGIRRIVPARELTLEEIRALAAACHSPAPCELEVFVHGALCMCYSGQCQMSRLLGDGKRSGNRGLCAQPCRLPYTDDQGRTGYFLSPKDLCLLEELPALCQAGVDSLKIEGRLKSPEYVAVVTGIYRKYLDQYARTGRVEVTEEDKAALTQIYSRGGFTTGYLYGNPGDRILSGQSPKNAGIYIGKVRSQVTAKTAGKDKAAAAGAAKKGAALVDILLQGELREGDGIEIRPVKDSRPEGKDSGGVVTFLKEMPGGAVRAGDIKGRAEAGDRVFRVTSRAQLEEARQTFSGQSTEDLDRQMKRRIPLRMEFGAEAGQPAVLRIWEGEMEVVVRSEEAAEPAQKRPSDPDRISGQLVKLGGTPFEAAAEDIQVDLDGRCVVPVSEINRMRREGIRQLLHEKTRPCRPPADLETLTRAEEELADSRLQIPAPDQVVQRLGRPVALEDFMAGEQGMPCLPEITKGRADAWLEDEFDEIVRAVKETGIILNNPGWIRRFQDAGVKVYGGHGLNVYNEQAARAYEQIGVEIVEASYEADQPLEGRIPLMITEHPVKSKTLTDRKGQVHRVETSPSGDKTLIW